MVTPANRSRSRRSMNRSGEALDKKGSPEGSNLGEPNPSEGSYGIARANPGCARILGPSIRINPRLCGASRGILPLGCAGHDRIGWKAVITQKPPAVWIGRGLMGGYLRGHLFRLRSERWLMQSGARIS